MRTDYFRATLSLQAGVARPGFVAKRQARFGPIQYLTHELFLEAAEFDGLFFRDYFSS